MPTLSSNANDQTPAPNRPRRNRLTLWLVLALCAAPVVASFVAYYWLQPSGHVNYGELLTPQPVPAATLAGVDTRPFSFADLKGSWVLVSIDGSACDERCRTKLLYMRQVRLAQGKNSDRIERVWLVNDDMFPNTAVVGEHPGLRVVRAPGSAVLAAFPAPTTPTAHIYVIDPLGNLMMRFPENPDPRGVLKDVSRLVRYSDWK
ncbi:MAG TPA: cytochrome C oxidase subunit I [Burkholderiales bacterium]|nr:cytochrome C oxidase subunit I [Burkholderiales bacterium]